MDNFFSKAYADTLYQPVDSDLTAIAALSTTVFGRALLALADAAALRSAIDFAEAVDDEVANLLVPANTDVNLTYNDAANTLTVGLGANVPRLNAASNAFTGNGSFGGTLTVTGQANFATNVNVTSGLFRSPNIEVTGTYFYWSSRSSMKSPTNGTFFFSNFSETAGVVIDVATDATLKIRNRANSADASIEIGTLRVGGGTIVQNILSATATLDFPSIAASSFADLTITVTGAVSGDTVIVNPIAGSATTDVVYTGWVSAANTVTIRASNVSSTTARDPASGTFRATVVRF